MTTGIGFTIERWNLDGFTLRVKSACFDDHLCLHLVATVPFDRPFLTNNSPIALPSGTQAFRTPTPSIGIDNTICHLVQSNSRGVVIVPGSSWIPLFAKDRDRISTTDVTSSIQGVDSHIQQQYMFHVISKATKVRPKIKVAIEGCEFSNSTRTEKLS